MGSCSTKLFDQVVRPSCSTKLFDQVVRPSCLTKLLDLYPLFQYHNKTPIFVDIVTWLGSVFTLLTEFHGLFIMHTIIAIIRKSVSISPL